MRKGSMARAVNFLDRKVQALDKKLSKVFSDEEFLLVVVKAESNAFNGHLSNGTRKMLEAR